MNEQHKEVWFVTGANKGLGAAIAREALDSGHWVVAAARKPEEVRAVPMPTIHRFACFAAGSPWMPWMRTSRTATQNSMRGGSSRQVRISSTDLHQRNCRKEESK